MRLVKPIRTLPNYLQGWERDREADHLNPDTGTHPALHVTNRPFETVPTPEGIST